MRDDVKTEFIVDLTFWAVIYKEIKVRTKSDKEIKVRTKSADRSRQTKKGVTSR